VDDFIDTNPMRISWTHNLKQDVARNHVYTFENECIVSSLYRPFTKQWLYYNRRFNERVYQMPRIFPDRKTENIVITVSAPGFTTGFCALITNTPPELCLAAMKGGTQCFPLYLYEDAVQVSNDDFFPEPQDVGLRRRDAITDTGLTHFQNAHPGQAISKEDLFYYVYGILHSSEYRERFADNFSKELPRIPTLKKTADFWSFSKAGRALADIHLNYETADPYALTVEAKGKLTDSDYRVEKMKFAKRKDPETNKNVDDRSTVIYNSRITIKGIPKEAWSYVVNGKPALDWVMERQAVRTDKASGIVNDANDWAIETMGNPRYPLELFQRVVTVSLETQKIVNNLPSLDI